MLSRVILYSAQGYAMGDLDPSMVMSCVRTEEINGEHSLSLSTVVHLYIGMRILMQDTTGKWREYVVDEEDEEHSSGRNAIGTYHAMWSIQYDLSTTAGGVQWASVEAGTNDPVTASNALAAALTDSVMWRPGTCDVVTLAAASFYDNSCWEYLSIIVETWGGEVDAEITVDNTGVVTRKVALMAHLGSATAKRRFDWGRDLTRIRRTPDPGPYYCRVVPRGGSEGTDSDGVKYSDRCGIESENDGIPYLQDDEAAELFKTLLPDGTWFYPTKVVNYQLDTKDDAEELYNKAVEDLYNHTRPNMSYEADVVQLAIAGLNIRGIALGDDVQCVDNGFGDIPLRIQGRVVSMAVNEMNPSDTTLTIGRMQHTLTDEFTSLSSTVGQVSSRVTLIESGGTSAYVRSLIDRMNQEINATDGWTYIVPNEGIVVYDIEVDDPIMGYNSTLDEYASSVVQIKGGGIRIANTRKPEFAGINDWDWKSVFDAGHIAAELVTAVNMTTGFIGNASSGTFIDLDNDVVRIGTTAQLGGRSVLDILDGIDATVTNVDVQFAESQSADTAPTTGWGTTAPAYREGYYIWQRTATTTGHGTSATTTYSDPVRINTRDGQDGEDGSDGKGISSIVEQYYLSTSSSTQTGGSWSATPAAYVSGRYYWTRTIITWSDNTTTTTTPVIARAINSANENALDARKVATNYLTFNSTAGLDVGYAGTSAKTRVNGSGVEIFDGDGRSAVLINTSGERIGHANEARLQMDYHSMYLVDKSNVKFFEAIDYRGTNSIADVTVEIRKIQGVTGWLLPHLVKTVQWVTSGGSRVPSSGTNRYSVTNSTDGYSVFGLHGTYANVANGTVIKIKYTTEQAFYSYLMGSRAANTAAGHASFAQGQNVAACGWGSHAEGKNTSAIGSWSHAEGYGTKALSNCDHAEGDDTTASGGFSHAEGRNSNATGEYSHAEGQTSASGMWAHSEGSGTGASGLCAHSEGGGTTASAEYSHAQNHGTIAASACQTAIGRYNLKDTSNAFAFVIGNGTPGTANTSEKRSNAFAIRWDGSAPTQSANTGFAINTTNVKSVSTQAYKRCLGVVQVAVGVTVKVAVAKGKSIVLGKLPAGYRPAQIAIADAGSFNRRASIATNGDITLTCETAVTSKSWSVTVRAVFLTP